MLNVLVLQTCNLSRKWKPQKVDRSTDHMEHIMISFNTTQVEFIWDFKIKLNPQIMTGLKAINL